jgi:Ran-binding protein 3
MFTCRAKVYCFDDGTWRERGVGNLKLNVSRLASDEGGAFEEEEEEEEEPSALSRKARFILRSDGSHRLVLNTPFTKEMKFGGDATGEKPTGSVLLFRGFLEGQEKQSALQIKVSFLLLLIAKHADVFL